MFSTHSSGEVHGVQGEGDVSDAAVTEMEAVLCMAV